MTFQSPEEFIRHMQEHHEHQQMTEEDIHHRRQAFLDGLSEDDLVMFRYMIRMTEGEAAAFLYGFTTQMLREKFGLCGCGKKHDKELEEIASDDNKEDTND